MPDINGIFKVFALGFIGNVAGGREVAFPEALPRHLLDGTVDSLHHVDRYLTHLHKKRKQIALSTWNATVLRAGAYLGEVIRHAAPAAELKWIDYNDYMPTQPMLRPLIGERTVATSAFLVGRGKGMIMPVNKIVRFIEEGPENNLHYFATGVIDDYQRAGENEDR